MMGGVSGTLFGAGFAKERAMWTPLHDAAFNEPLAASAIGLPRLDGLPITSYGTPGPQTDSGHIVDIVRVWRRNQLISLARPTGLEPVLPP
jgi:hypothetical protein